MRDSLRRLAAYALSALLALCLAALPVPAQRSGERNIDPSKLNEAREESRQAAEVFREIMAVPENQIPRELLERAEAIAVFPNVLRAAFIVGGRGGDGVISRRTPAGWSAPAFFNLGGGSFGAQVGASSTDYVLLFMNEGALRGLLEDRFEFGGEVGIAAGPVGRAASAATNLTLDAGILSYSRSQGAFIGAALRGAVITPDNDLNRAIYGMTARDLLARGHSGMIAELPEAVRSFPQILANYSPRRAQNSNSLQDSNQPTTRSGQQTNSTTASDAIGQRRAADRLTREVRHELLLLPYYGVFDWLEYQVGGDGTVTLRGQVTRPTIRTSAEAAVRDIEGVTRVVNEIEVLPVSPNDDRLREALYRAVYSGPLFRYAVGSLNSIHIIVRNGRATLKGVVNSAADKQLAYIQARGVPGVFAVTNDLHVEGAQIR